MKPKISVSDFDKIRKLYVAAVEGGTLGHVVTTPSLEGIRVTDLYVHPSARRLGVASSLIDEVKKRNKGNVLRLRARPYGVKGPDLTRLKDFYRRAGFVDDIAANDTMMQKVAQLNKLGTLDTRPYRQRSEVIPTRGYKVMAFRQPEGNITFPGGGIDPGETPLQAAQREAFEESGVKVRSLRPAGIPSVKKQWNARQLATTNPEHMRRNREFQGSEAHYFIGNVRNPRRLHRGDFDVDAPTPGKLVWMHPYQAIKNLQSKPSVTNEARIAVLQRVLQNLKRKSLLSFLAKRSSYSVLNLQKDAFLSGATAALLKSRLINSGLGLMRQLGIGKNLYSSISRSGIERGWRGTESPLGIAAQSWAGFSPTASGTTDFGLGTLMGSKLRESYRGTFAPHVQSAQMPEASSYVNFLRGGNIKNLRNLTDPLAREIANLPRGTPPERVNELAYKLFQAQKGLKQNRAVALSRLPSEFQPMVMGQLQPKSPILRHAQTALTSPVNAQLEQKARNLQNSLVWSYLFNAPKSHSALTGAGLASALTNWGMPANAYAGAALGSVLGAAPAAGMLELGQKGRHGLMGKALGLSTLAGYRKSKLPSWLANILGLVEPSILEAAQAGRDLRRAVPSGAVAQRVKQLANMPLREAIHRDMGRFSRLLNYVWPMRKLASFSRRDIFKNLLKGFVKNEPPLISAVPGVAAATEAINKTAPQFTRREFSKFMGLTAASAPRVFNYLARPPFTMVRTLTKNPFLPMKMADSPFLNFVNWVNRKIMGKPMKGPYDLSVGPGLRYNLFKESAAELPYRDRSELIARLKDKVLAMEYAHGGIGFYGGGIDPGENPTDAAAREFFEESGRKAKNVRPAGVPPVTLEWTPEMIEENPKLKARAGQFRGSRTHYFVGDVAGRKRHHEKDLDTTTSTSSKPVWLTPEEAISRIEGYGGVDDTTKVLAQQRKDISAARMQILRQILSERQAKAASMSSDGKPEEHVKSALTAGRIRYWANKLGILQVPWSDWKYGTKMLMKAEHAKRTAGAAAGDVYLRRAGLPTSAEMDKLRKMYLRFYRHPEEAIRRKELQYYVDRPGVWKTLRMMEGGGGEVAPIIREIAERRKFKPPTPQQLRNYEFMVTTPPGGKPIGRVGEDSSVPGRFLVADRLAFERRRDELIDKLNRLDMKITDPWVSASARTKFSRMKRELDAKFRELTGKGTRVVHTHPPFSDPLHFIFYENWMRALPSGLTPDKKFSYNKAQQYIEQARKGIQRPTSDLRIMSTSPAQVAVPIAVVPGNLQAGIKVIPGSTSRWAKKRKEPVLKRIFFREGPEKIYPPYRSRGKQASADFAPGLPDRSRFGDVTKLPKEQALKFVIQEHLAQRSGRHYDVRMGTPDTGLYSWATKKEWPGPGGKIMLFQQPVHRYEYGDFQGRIPKGYGKGIVKTHDKGAILVTHAADNKIKFIVAHRGTPEYYTLIRRSGPPENPRTERQRHSQGGQWLLINTTPTDVKKWIGLDPKDMAKLRYKSIPAKDVEKLFTQGNIIQNKVDGASMLYRLLNDHIEATSYRVSKEGRPIVHTQRLFGPGGMKVNIPKEHVGTVLRGEAYGTREGKAIPPQELGGILNASLIHSLEKQRANNVQMKSMLFDVAGEQDKPYAERLSKLESITKLLPQEHFHLPESAKTPEEARALWETISGGKHPLTREGVVAWPPQGVPTKAKLMPESDVWIRNVFPGEGKYKGSGAGGVEYSLSPEGEVVGRIGTGFSDEMRRDMIQHPERYVGRLARIGSQEQFPSGAHRAPAFLALHEDYPTKVAQLDQVKEAGQALRAIWKGLSSVVRPSPGIPKLNVAPGPFYSQRLHAAVRMPELYHGLSQKGFKVVRQRIKEPTSIAGHIQAGRTGLPDDVLGMQVYARGLGDVEQALQTLRQLGVRRISSKAFVKPTYHGINVKGMYRGIPMELQLSPGRLANFGQIALHSLSYKPRAVLGGLDKLIAGKILPWFSGSSWMSKSLPQLQKMMPIKTASEHALAGATVLLESLALANTMRERRKKLKTMHRKKSSLIGEVKRRALAYGD